jgi:hypothetical protein
MKDTELLAQIAQDVLCDGGQFQLNSTQLNAFDLALRKTDHSRDATRDADTELGQQTAQCVNELGPVNAIQKCHRSRKAGMSPRMAAMRSYVILSGFEGAMVFI